MNDSWRPLCSIDAITIRSRLYKRIRDFFEIRGVLEVETPLLSRATVTDPFIASLEVSLPNDTEHIYYLQTSPEFAMKKMLCSGIGSIFQICKAFRAEEQGVNHNQEFTMLEWYRLGFNLEDLMQEMQELLLYIFDENPSQETVKQCIKISYTELFLHYLQFDHNKVEIDYLINVIKKIFDDQFDAVLEHDKFEQLFNKDDLLMILLSNYIEPRLEKNNIYFLYDFPATQAALARVDNTGNYPVAKRFEVYFQGVELANGYYELADFKDQQARFQRDLTRRKQQNLPLVAVDNDLISALKNGLPECSGVAMGLDRILMILLQTKNIEDVLVFR